MKTKTETKTNLNKQLAKIATLTTATIITAVALDVRLKVVNYKIRSNKVKSKVKIALITDLHSCKYGQSQSTLISAINKSNPDVVLLGHGRFINIRKKKKKKL